MKNINHSAKRQVPDNVLTIQLSDVLAMHEKLVLLDQLLWWLESQSTLLFPEQPARLPVADHNQLILPL